LWIIADSVKTYHCDGDDKITCLCEVKVYRDLDCLLRYVGLVRRRLKAETLPEGCMPVVYSEELILDGEKPVALIAVKKSYDNEEIKVTVDVIDVYDSEAREVLCRKTSQATACRKVVATV